MEKDNSIYESLLMNSPTAHRGFDWTFKKIGALFNGLNIDYALIGAVAMGISTPYQRFTQDIDILTYDQHRRAIHHEMLRNSFVTRQNGLDPGTYLVRYMDTETRIEVDILYSDDMIDPEASAVALAVKATAFDTTVNVCTPEMAIWLYLHSNQIRHKSDIVQLLKTGRVDVPKLCRYIKDADQAFLLEELNLLIKRANDEMKPSKYNVSTSTTVLPTIEGRGK